MTNSLNKKISDRIKYLHRFFELEHILKQLEAAVGYLVPHRSNIKLKLTIGGGSSTNGDSITVGLPEYMIEATDEEILATLRAILAHETQHINSSDFKGYGEFISRIVTYFQQHKQLSEGKTFNRAVLKNIATSFGNGIEDGRIENILGHNRPGYVKYLQFFRGKWWEAQPVKEDDSELQTFLWAVVTIATTGLYPKNFDLYFKGSETEKELKKIEKEIIAATNDRTSGICLSSCEKLILKSEDFILKHLKELTEEQKKEMANNSSSDEWTTSEENEMNESTDESNPIHFTFEDESEGSAAESDEESKNITKSKMGDTEDNSTEDKNQRMEKLIEKISEELQKEIVESKALKENEKEEKRNKKEESELNKEELSEVTSRCLGLYSDEYKETTNSVLDKELTPEMKAESRVLRKQMEQIFRNKSTQTAKFQKKGMLDSSALWKLGIGETNVFQVKGVESVTDCAAYLLWDGSGSMGGQKYRDSGKAISLAEEALKGLMPFKIVQFGTEQFGMYISHRIVKSFKQEKKINYTYNFMKNENPKGGNADGFSIRIATAELLKRPEKERILFVFSDGDPSFYKSDREALDDVKKAVKEAKSKGILVIAIQFGSPSFLINSRKNYEYMYERNIISCESKDLTMQMIRLLKKVIR